MAQPLTRSGARSVPGTLRRMRDTDADWTIIGESHPFFGVLADEKYRSDRITPAAINEFYASGVADIDAVVSRFERLWPVPFRPDVALDFGSGTGRLAFAMSDHAGRVIGVDIADGMRAVAKREASSRGVANVEFRPDLPAEPVDWVNSLIVFQHIPPRRGTDILRGLIGLLRPGGYFSVQVTFFKDERHTAEVGRDLRDYRYDGESVELIVAPPALHAGSMTMYDYDLNLVFHALVRGGLTNVWVEHTDHGGCHGLYLFGRRAE